MSHSTDASQLERIADLPAPASLIFADRQDRIAMVFTGDTGLGLLRDQILDIVVEGPVISAAPSPQGGVYFTNGNQLSHSDLAGTISDQTELFGAIPKGISRLVLAPDRSLWLQGVSQKMTADGLLQAVPTHAGQTPIPLTTDIYNNAWTLTPNPAAGTEVMVLPANDAEHWQVVPLNVADRERHWEFIFADQVGFIWLGGPAGLRRFNPRQPDAAWQDLGDTALTALGSSADGLALIGYATGELVEMDIDAEGNALVMALPSAPEAVRCTYVAGDGAIWAATAKTLYRYSPAPGAWQRHWRQLGALPGGNHDIFSVVLADKLYTAGGLTAGWGYPPRTHVFDELFAYEPEYDRWTVVSHMPLPRCYNGIAVVAGQIWVVGGSANLHEPENPDGKRLPLDSVYFYDIKQAIWIAAPALNIARNEPTVLAAGGRLYAIGGHSQDSTLASVESIAPGENAWRFEMPMPVPFNQAAGCVIGEILYCINKEGFWAYDTTSGEWDSELPQLAESPQAALMGVYNDEILVMGGSRLKAGHRYSPSLRQWFPAPDLPTDQSWGAAHTVRGQLIIAGGAHWSEVRQTYIYENRAFALRNDAARSAE